MIDAKVKLLKSLIEIPSPSGFEEKLAERIKTELLNYLPRTRVTIDSKNSVVARIPGTSKETIMIDAHLDEIGFVVTNVDHRGIISIAYIGGGCTSILSARELVILTDKGAVNAVVDRNHAHLVENESNEAIDSITEAQVDIGIRKRKQVLKHVKIGDPIVYRSSFNQLIGNYYAGYGFDDKAGCYILMQTIKEIQKSKKKPQANLVFSFTAQEETGKMKVKQVIRQYKPDLFINVDVTFATDYLNDELEREAGKCELGNGMVLYRGVGIDKGVNQLIESVCRTNKIKLQYQAEGGHAGFNYDAIDDLGYDTKVVNLGIPLRNMHTPVETINLKDLNYGVNILKNLLLSNRLRRVIVR